MQFHINNMIKLIKQQSLAYLVADSVSCNKFPLTPSKKWLIMINY